MSATPPRILWRRLQEEALALSRGVGSVTAVSQALRHTTGVRFPNLDNGAQKEAGRLVRLVNRYGVATAEGREALAPQLADLALIVGERLDAVRPRPSYRADVDG